MTRRGPTTGSISRPYHRLPVLGLAFFLLIPGLVGLPTHAASAATVRPSDGVAFVNISATTTFGFDPSQVTVVAGQSVHLRVTQLANFDHTFVLSPIANFAFVSTNTTSDLVVFFRAHAPLVNLSLGSTPGAVTTAIFVAPAAGSYEFVCVVKDHFQGGMHGQLVSNAPGSTPAPASGGTSMTTTYLVLGVVAVVVVAVIAAAYMMRQRKGPA